jgi:hypothetical protein
MLINTIKTIMITGTTQEGKDEPLPIQNSTMTADADNSAGIVNAQLIKYIHLR